MRLFYVNGEAQVSMSLHELEKALDEAHDNAPAIQATATVNGSKTRPVRVGRKPVARKSARSRRVLSRSMVKRTVKRNVKATTKPKRKVAKRDWGPIIAKRNRTIAEKKAQQQPAAQPMAAAQ